MQSKTTMLGLDFGASTLKWTLMERGSVKQAQELPLPENLTRDSHIGSVQMMGDTLRVLSARTVSAASPARWCCPQRM